MLDEQTAIVHFPDSIHFLPKMPLILTSREVVPFVVATVPKSSYRRNRHAI